MLNRTNIKGYEELKAERSQFKQNALESIDKILDGIDDVANIEECFEIRTGLEVVYLMCHMPDNTISIVINNLNLDFALIELDKNEVIKDLSISSPEDVVNKINQFIHQNSSEEIEDIFPVADTPICNEASKETIKNIRNKISSYIDNTNLIVCHKNILIQTISDMILAESLKTEVVKEEVINDLKNKIHKELNSIDSLELKVIEEEKELREYASLTDIESEVDLVTDVIDILKDRMDVINIIIQFKEDELKISKMNTYNQNEYSIENLEKMIKSANDKLASIEIQIDQLMK